MSEADDERARERAVILQRRAKLVAYAVAAGVATVACSGKTSSVCLSLPAMGGSGGTAVTSGGRGFCLTAPMGGAGGFGGVVSAGTGGTDVQICLQPPIGGATTDPVAGANSGGEPSEGGATGEAGAPSEGGAAGAPPVLCLVPPA